MNKKTAVICRHCNWDGYLYLTTRHWWGKYPSVTGIPCPACKKHKLHRVK